MVEMEGMGEDDGEERNLVEATLKKIRMKSLRESVADLRQRTRMAVEVAQEEVASHRS
jgi:hypothetical protein